MHICIQNIYLFTINFLMSGRIERFQFGTAQMFHYLYAEASFNWTPQKIRWVSQTLQPSTKSELSLWRTGFCRFASQKQQVGNFQSCLIYIHMPSIARERCRTSNAVLFATSSYQRELALPSPGVASCGECLFPSRPTKGRTLRAAPAWGGWRLFCLSESGTGISLENYMYQHMHF